MNNLIAYALYDTLCDLQSELNYSESEDLKEAKELVEKCLELAYKLL